MIQPTFVMDHPIEISPLTKKKPEDPNYVERFEFFMNGWELANAYSELNDPLTRESGSPSRTPTRRPETRRRSTPMKTSSMPWRSACPPTGGIGFGIDRMCMLLTDSAAIRDVLLFPTMKSIGGAEGKKTDKKESPTGCEDRSFQGESRAAVRGGR